jgi:hypothetical protein
METNELTAIMVIEVLGRPVEHVNSVISDLINRLEKEAGIKLIKKKVAEPKQIEQLFSTFCEVEIKVESLHRLIEVCMDYLPSSVEIVEPEKIELKLQDGNAVINYLLAKLHKYEEIVQVLNAEREIMYNQLAAKGEKPAFLPILEELKKQDKMLAQQKSSVNEKVAKKKKIIKAKKSKKK